MEGIFDPALFKAQAAADGHVKFADLSSVFSNIVMHSFTAQNVVEVAYSSIKTPLSNDLSPEFFYELFGRINSLAAPDNPVIPVGLEYTYQLLLDSPAFYVYDQNGGFITLTGVVDQLAFWP